MNRQVEIVPEATYGAAHPLTHSPAELGESPLWDSSHGLRWVDVAGGHLYSLDDRGKESSISLSRRVTCIELGPQGTLVAASQAGFARVDPVTGTVTPLIDVVDGQKVTMNDGAVDPVGRLWAGSAVRDDSRAGGLFNYNGKEVIQRLEDVGMSNGIGWSPEGDTMYHVDSAEGTLTAWEFDPAAGTLGTQTELLRISRAVGTPDGLDVDAGGDIWLAVWGPGQVWRIDATTGMILDVVSVPTPCATSCAFGGDTMSTLFITTANYQEPPGGGLVYAVEVHARGQTPRCYEGET